ncbi:Ppx/GppA phosphatase family protein [Collimonas sp.]|jgi:exopolyphosphatase/guanosine-5'-triphosphate,3'-diphosphate pyrophosphatase|uniref:Ppx/GppA phosphatase family protein n=1 Tax=Collimonas sp. TaxID=1963772 RepID=UPI002CECF004|nr:Ppx/GppA phosphatase family protein [Collimonas sp.]HWW07681.1 Ppx/GppA phosphatase family protein [Collimonas sp.]
MFAAVDLGSNSFRLHIGKYNGDAIRVIKSARDPIRLAAGLDSKGYLTEQAMQVALDSLSRFRNILADYQLEAVRVVATNTLRVAKNAAEFLPIAEQVIGYPIEIISGEEEGRLIYMGVSSMLRLPNEKRLVLDIGGGSTELILGRGQQIERVESFGIGTVNQSLAFFADGQITAAAYDAAVLSARSHFEDAAPPYRPQNWSHAYGSSGTIRAIAETIERNSLGDHRLSYTSLEALRARFIEFGHVSRIDLLGMKPERAAVMVGGLAVLIGLMQELGIEVLQPIEAGLRMGVMWDLQLRGTRLDRRDQSVHDFSQRFHVDQLRASRVAETATSLFEMLKPSSDGLSQYLHWSALLHEVGLVVSQSGYHKHAAYLIENADLSGFTTREQRAMSMLILGQKGNLRKISDALLDPDFSKAVLALRLAVMFLHSRIEVDLDELRLKMKSKIELDIKRDWIEDHPTATYWMTKEQDWWREIGVDFAIRRT